MKLVHCLSCLCLMFMSQVSGASNIRDWQYSVYLDDREIGFYALRQEAVEGGLQVSIVTVLRWTLMKIPLYSYQHQNTELWVGSCLQRVASTTLDNGDNNFVSAQKTPRGLQLETHNGDVKLEGCIRSFAYWDPTILDAPKLLNTQTGEYLDTSLVPLSGTGPALKNGLKVSRGYRLLMADRSIDLWYSDQMEWLALQTRVRGNRMLSYLRTT